ncbi:MAG TPA: hypothetical protein VFB79_04060 [Candidatus Angelobacter sp.]|nr:hypothetical protein [Candidatus Angelobacter sp.]
MAGLISDNLPRVIDSKTHGIIDYIHAGTNILAGILFRQRDRRASNAAFALGAAVLVNALCTDYEAGVFRLYNFRVHGILDYGVAAASAAMPLMLGLEGTAERSYFYGQGGGETVIAGITDYTDDSGARRYFSSDTEIERAA